MCETTWYFSKKMKVKACMHKNFKVDLLYDSQGAFHLETSGHQPPPPKSSHALNYANRFSPHTAVMREEFSCRDSDLLCTKLYTCLFLL